VDRQNEGAGGGLTALRASEVVARYAAQPLPPGLYLVATPIGNLADITLRALATLVRADVIYCEDTRHSRTLLAHFSIARPLRTYQEHNAERERPRILAELAAGKAIALISDAGTPLVSDPGYKLVRDCLSAGHRVTSLPGPTAVLAAVASSGLPTDTFLFAGVLPAKQRARRARLAELKAVPATLVFFEAPTRLAETLADMAEIFGEREGAVARELTKLHEETLRGSLSNLAELAAKESLKGEMVVLVGPPMPEAVKDDAIAARIEPLLDEVSLSDAARTVADALGVARARAYDIGLALKKARDQQ
jgi:16S rRNA (cytidine1402-2'-O)-methyltransferase